MFIPVHVQYFDCIGLSVVFARNLIGCGYGHGDLLGRNDQLELTGVLLDI